MKSETKGAHRGSDESSSKAGGCLEDDAEEISESAHEKEAASSHFSGNDSKFSDNSRAVKDEKDVSTYATTADSTILELPSLPYDEFDGELPKTVSPRDRLSYVDDKKTLKEMDKFFERNSGIHHMIRLMKTEIMRKQPDNILDFIIDDFFSLENQTKLRNIMNEFRKH